ncbi:class II fructose-bisphosphate aldolase [Pseudarthrobacter sp. P1]|uniref:class II fructose-bisphosphate aldolase n=1 Tax=Pseudarthrobacter sp. P1 TaxID=3418418 RepID=UPI003CF73E3E
MRARMNDLAAKALARGGAVPAFTCYDFSTALAVVAAAESAGQSVVLNVAPKTAATPNGRRLIAALRSLADNAAVPVCVQLDHASNLDVIAAAVAAGADAVLADGSALPYEENIALVRAVRALVGEDIVLEAELGGLAGDEDKAFALDAAEQAAAGLTDAAQVADFVARTGAQLLAVAVGNVHGKYRGAPALRWNLMKEISAVSAVPLVLHGASGIPAKDLAAAPELGVGKVNFNTELRTALLSTVEDSVAAHRADGEDLQGLLGRWTASAGGFATATLATLDGTA